MDRKVTGRAAFVSGSGRNIGRAIALDLARRGCNVVVNGSSDSAACEAVAQEARALGVEALVAMGDMGAAAEVARVTAAALERFGRIDIVVNNAAFRPHKPFLETTEDDWRRVLDLDLDASFRTAKAFLPGMVAAGWGRVICLTGMKAIRGYVEGAPISVAKHGLWGLTKALAREFGPQGITANAVSPGPIAADGVDPAATDMTATVPLGHKGRPADIAAVVGFLVSDEGGFVTGQMIAANGGAQT